MQGPEKRSFQVFIVPDGDRRWADDHKLNHYAGYRAGHKAFREQAHTIWDHGVTHVTAWGLSLDNLRERNTEDLGAVFSVLADAIKEFFEEIPVMKRKIRFRAVGDWRALFPSRFSDQIEALERATAHHDQGVLTLLLAYDGDKELCDVSRRVAAQPPQNEVSFEFLKSLAATHFLPNVDIYLRTGGEPHLSGNALPFQMRNPELFFPEKYWPDFTVDDMASVIAEYKERRKRHGA